MKQKILSTLILMLSSNFVVATEVIDYIKTIELKNDLATMYSGSINPDSICKMKNAGRAVKQTYELIEFEYVPGFKELPIMKIINDNLQEENSELEYVTKAQKYHPKTCIAWSPKYNNDMAEFYHAESGWKCSKYQAAYYGTV